MQWPILCAMKSHFELARKDTAIQYFIVAHADLAEQIFRPSG
jgi:hypothetical protein